MRDPARSVPTSSSRVQVFVDILDDAILLVLVKRHRLQGARRPATLSTPVVPALERTVNGRHGIFLLDFPLPNIRQEVLYGFCALAVATNLQRLLQFPPVVVLLIRANDLEIPVLEVELVVDAVGELVARLRLLVLVNSVLLVYVVVVFVLGFVIRDCLELSARFDRFLLHEPCFDGVVKTVIVIDLDRRGVVFVKVTLYKVVQVPPPCITAKNKRPTCHLQMVHMVRIVFLLDIS